jgi:hypothetical protein
MRTHAAAIALAATPAVAVEMIEKSYRDVPVHSVLVIIGRQKNASEDLRDWERRAGGI